MSERRHHIETMPGDGNGTPAGLRISWPALTVLVTVTIGLFGLINFVRISDVSAIENQIASVRQQFLDYKLERQGESVQREHQLDRIEVAVTDLQKAVAGLQATVNRERR